MIHRLNRHSHDVACRYMLATYFTALPPSEVTREALNLVCYMPFCAGAADNPEQASKIREFAIDIEKKGALSHCKMFALDSFCAPKVRILSCQRATLLTTQYTCSSLTRCMMRCCPILTLCTLIRFARLTSTPKRQEPFAHLFKEHRCIPRK